MFRRYIREGRGQGVGASYKPWITVRDFPSRGMVSRVKGQKTGRIYHLMSNYETALFYLLDWSDNVIDIREQYPLSDLSKVIEIAEAAQIKYPYDSRSGFPYVITSDFYIETTSGIIVIAVKPTSELEKPRVREKLEIERRYWISQNIKWEIVTDREINHDKARNIEWLSQAQDLARFGLDLELQAKCIDFFMASYVAYSGSLSRLLLDLERHFELLSGMGLNIYKHLVYWKVINVDVSQLANFSLYS
jgi:hypothetical protein